MNKHIPGLMKLCLQGYQEVMWYTMGDIVVSMLSGRIMTYLGFKELWVDEFSVHPDYQRQGIGTKMIEYVREQLKQETEKISYIVLNTERGYPSVKFYEANGFEADESLVFMAADV